MSLEGCIIKVQENPNEFEVVLDKPDELIVKLKGDTSNNPDKQWNVEKYRGTLEILTRPADTGISGKPNVADKVGPVKDPDVEEV